MAKIFFLLSAPLSVGLIWLLALLDQNFYYFYFLAIPYCLVGVFDLVSSDNVLRNYPVIGHLRYLLEYIRPEIHQYFVESNQNGRPFSREQRTMVYQRARKALDTLPFGTQHDLTEEGYLFTVHSLAPVVVERNQARVVVGNHQCSQPYDASRLNVSGMSFGAISQTAIESLNWGAKLGRFYQNTGEGGLTPYHLKHGGDLVLQLGTANFGFRNKDGSFSPAKFREKSRLEQVKMIEIKLSQGAKPAHGGLLPKSKISAEIAEIRGIDRNHDCFSPAVNPMADTPRALMEFVDTLRTLSGGKPVGFKLAIGQKKDFFAICKAMLETQIYPDFITIDGAEGGTGAAPVEFSNRLGLPLSEALAFVHNALIGVGLREHIRLIASGKVVSGFDLIYRFALGADICNAARSMMLALGCIQSLRCNTNECPTGIATQNQARTRAIIPSVKSLRVANYHHHTISSFLELLGAMGLSTVDALTAEYVYQRMSDGNAKAVADVYPSLQPKQLLEGDVPACFAPAWVQASADHY